MSRTRGREPRWAGATAGPGGRPSGSHGFTLVEVVIAAVILVIAVGGLTGSILAGLKLSRTNEEDARAEEGLRSALAGLEGTAFGDVFAAFNSDPDDDPVPAPGAGFAVEGLTAVAGDPDGLVGEVIFPTVANGGTLELREDVADPAFQMPRDLSGDGGWDNENHADDYVILPVRVRVRWSGASGERVRERSVLLVE